MLIFPMTQSGTLPSTGLSLGRRASPGECFGSKGAAGCLSLCHTCDEPADRPSSPARLLPIQACLAQRLLCIPVMAHSILGDKWETEDSNLTPDNT